MILESIHTRNKVLKLFGYFKAFQKKIFKDYIEMTDDEFDEQMRFERWCKGVKHTTKQTVHLMEAFEAFDDLVYDMCMMNIADSKESKESRDHFKKILEKYKAWKNKDNDLMIDQAKAYPITSLVSQFATEDKEISFYRNVKCILHEDSTASMKLYQNNTYYCFGCNQGGDTIDLLMRKRNIDFISAVKWLTNS